MNQSRRQSLVRGGFVTMLLAGLALILALTTDAEASWPWRTSRCPPVCDHQAPSYVEGDWAGSWYWLRSPEQEKRVVLRLYNLYCARCHAVDGRGVWDIPDLPDFTNARWQASRSDAQLTRLILEGRGAVMPAFRGTLTLEESWAMARYLRTLVPGTQTPRPDLREPEKPAGGTPKPPTGQP